MVNRRISRRAFGRVIGGLVFLVPLLPFVSRSAAAADPRGRWECQNDQCEPYVYDPAIGDPVWDIPPGTPFEDVPDDWECPICGDSKRQFIPYE